MKKLLLFIPLLFVGLIVQFASSGYNFVLPYYQLRSSSYDSVGIGPKLILGTVSSGNSTDAVLVRRANGGVFSVPQSNFATASGYVANTGNTSIDGDKKFWNGSGAYSLINSTGLLVMNSAGTISTKSTSSAYQFINNTYTLSLQSSGLSSNRTQTYQNRDGVIALLDDVPRAIARAASGDGSSTTITVPHLLSGVTPASVVVATPNNSAAAGFNFVTIDATNVYFNYTVAPVSGTNNLSYSIIIK